MNDEAPIESARIQIAPLPRVSIQAFCETSDIAALINEAATDRRMVKPHVKVQMGGIVGAIETYRNAPTPNVIVIECVHDARQLLEHLDELAHLCDAGTKVVIVARYNDIALYRELMARGVSDYLVAPLDTIGFIRSLSALYTTPGATPVGRVIAVVGAKGGVGSSCIAHNIAWSMSRSFDMSTVIVDMDLGFGTAGLDFNQDPPQGIAEAVFAPDRLDNNLVDRLLSKCSDKLSILAAPATLERLYDLDETSFDVLMDILRASTPLIIVDLPHLWTAWARRMLVSADDIVLVAGPDLANLRNAKNIVDTLRAARPNDSRPKLIMNMTGVPKRPEISVDDFAKALELDPVGVLPYDAKLFGTAANNGQMLAEVEASHKITETIGEIASMLMGRTETRQAKRNLLEPLVSRFKRKKAS